MILQGHIKTIKSSETIMGDMVNLVTFEVHGEIKDLHDLQKKVLTITLEPNDLP